MIGGSSWPRITDGSKKPMSNRVKAVLQKNNWPEFLSSEIVQLQFSSVQFSITEFRLYIWVEKNRSVSAQREVFWVRHS